MYTLDVWKCVLFTIYNIYIYKNKKYIKKQQPEKNIGAKTQPRLLELSFMTRSSKYKQQNNYITFVSC